MVVRRVRVPVRDVVYIKGIVEASNGVAAVLSEPRSSPDADGGALIIVAPRSRQRDLDVLLADLRAELASFSEVVR